MRSVANALMQNAVGMSVVIAVLLLARPWLVGHARPQTRYAAWLILCLGLLLPFRLSMTPFWTMTAPQARAPVAVQTSAPVSGERLPSAQAAPGVQQPAEASGAVQEAGPQAPVLALRTQEPQAKLAFQWPDPYTLLLTLWLAGAVAALAVQLLRHLRFFRRVRRWQSEPGEGQRRMLLEEQERLGLKGPIRLMGCACVAGPMVAGLFRPLLLLPDMDLSQEELRLVLRHELTHVKRRDLWGKALMLCCLTLHWFNPLVYAMARAMAGDCEMSCDASVLANADMAQRKRYGEAILGMIRRQKQRQIALSTYFYEGKIDMKKRFASMLDPSVRPKGVAVLAAALALTLLSGSVLAIDNALPASAGGSAIFAPAAIPQDWDKHPTPALFSITAEMHPEYYQLAYEVPEPAPYNRMLTRRETLRLYDLYYFYDHDGRRAAQPAPVAENPGNGFGVSAPVEEFAALIPLDQRTENVYGQGLWDAAQAKGLMPFLLLPDREMNDEELLQLIQVVDAFDALAPYVDPYSFGDAADLENRPMTRLETLRYWEALDRCENDPAYRPTGALTNVPGPGLYIKGYNGGGETVYHYPEGREMTDEEILQMSWETVQRRQRSQAEADYQAQNPPEPQSGSQEAPVGTAELALEKALPLLEGANVKLAGAPVYNPQERTWSLSFEENVPVGASLYLYDFTIDPATGDVTRASQHYWQRVTVRSYLLGEMLGDPRGLYQVRDAADPHWVEAAWEHLSRGQYFYTGAEVKEVRSDGSMNGFCVKVEYADGQKAFLFLDPVTDALVDYHMISDEELGTLWAGYIW